MASPIGIKARVLPEVMVQVRYECLHDRAGREARSVRPCNPALRSERFGSVTGDFDARRRCGSRSGAVRAAAAPP